MSGQQAEVGDAGRKVSRQSRPSHGGGRIGRAERRPDREDLAAGKVFDTPSPGRADQKTHRNPGGRPPHRPTVTTRRIVENCAAALIPHATIAPLVGLGSVNTLKRHYLEELARGGAKASLRIAEKLQKLVEAGNVEAILLIAKVKLGLREPQVPGRIGTRQ